MQICICSSKPQNEGAAGLRNAINKTNILQYVIGKTFQLKQRPRILRNLYLVWSSQSE